MKSTLSLRSSIQNKSQSLPTRTRSLRLPVLTRRLFLLTLVSFVAVAAVLGIAASANKANRAAKALQSRQTQAAAQATQAGAPKSVTIKNSDGQQPLAPNATVITATLDDNVAAATKVAPGGTINYTAVIKNTGTAGTDDATSVNYSHLLDSNTTLAAGSVHASPIAFNNAYTTAIGNTLLEVSNSPSSTAPKVTAAGTLFDNDTIATAPDTFVLQSFQNPSANSGTVAVNANGSFTYLPAAGFTGTDTFTYTIRNSADATLTDTATVTITVNTPRVWYVDNSGANGDGRSTSPFNTLAGAAAVDGVGDIIYIFTGGGNYTGGITLLNNEQVIGNGVPLVVNTITLRAAGSRPTVVNGAGNGITLGSANTLSGFNFGACSGFAIQGTSVGTLTVGTMLINNTSGGALDLTGVGTPTVSVVLDSTTSSGGTKNVNLVGLNGTITLAGGALSAASGNAFDVSGGAATITFSGTIGNTTARAVNVASMTGGSVALSGAITGSSSNTGINLTTNTGATITFTGLITLNGTGSVFTATGGGTVTANNAGNTIGATTAPSSTALNVSNTTIGAANMIFTSISCNGATKGIILNTTGAGSLSVTGTGTTAGSGGTIQNISLRGGEFTSTSNLSLKNMNFINANTADAGGAGVCDDTTTTACNAVVYLSSTTTTTLDRINITGTIAEEGINGNSVNGLVLSNSNIGTAAGHCGDAVEEGCMKMRQWSGTSSITSSDLAFAAEDVLEILNQSGTLTLTVTGSTFRDTQPNPPGSTGIIARSRGTGSMILNIVNSNFLRLRSNAFNATSQDSASLDVDVSGSTFDSEAGIGIGIVLASDNTSNMVFNIQNNPKIWSRNGIAVSVLGDGTSTFMGRIQNNPSIQVQSGSGTGIGTQANTNATGVVSITGNTIIGVPVDAGITAIALGETNNGPGSLNATITGNNVTIADIATYNIETRSGSGTAGETQQPVCVNVANNVIGDPSPGGQPYGGIFTWRARVANAAPNALLNVQGFNTNIATTWANNGNTPAAGTSQSLAAGATPIGSCTATVPSNPALNLNFTPGETAAIAPQDPLPAHDASATTQTARSQQAAQVATASGSVAAGRQVAPTANNSSSVIANAAPSNRRKRGDVLSHHAVRSSSRASDESPNAPLVTVSVALGTLPALPGGKVVTIKYAVMVNTPPLARQISAQGAVTFNGNPGGSVNTTDFSPPNGPNTVTLIDTAITWTGAVDTNWNTPGNWTVPGPPVTVATYAPGVTNPAVNEVTIPAVANQPTIPSGGGDISIYSLSLANTMTLTIGTGRILTIGGSPGGDLALNGVITGGELRFGTGTHNITNTGTGSLSSTNLATVLSGSIVTLGANLQAGALAINSGGSMDISGGGGRLLSLNGTGGLAVAGGGTLTTTGSTVTFNGTAAQQAAGIAYHNLTINNTIGANVTGVTLTGNAIVNGTLTLTSSDLNTSTFTLTQPNTTASTGVSDVVGTVIRSGGPFPAATALTFGNPNNRITFAVAVTNPTTVTVLMAKTAPATYAAAVTRNYTISTTGSNTSTATLRLHYLDGELNSNVEANLNLRRLRTSDNHWVAQIPDTVDTTNNFVETTGSTVVGTNLPTQWTFSSLAPTAAGGVVTGRIVDNNGNPVEGAVVRLSGTQNRKFITDANGFYRFDNVETTGFYTVTPSRVNYTFNPSSHSFSQIGETTEAAFGATATGQNANPLDTPEYFVRQHYLDFLGREPDEAGFNFWSDEILGCGNDNQCIDRKRENVSAAYFLSIEFQKTGGLVDGLYRAAYGARPDFGQFMPDTRTVGLGVQVGKDGWEAKLAANKEAFLNAFVNRAAFHAAYDGMEPSLFVDTLISHTGVTFTSGERDALVSGLSTGTMTRAEALRSIAENNRFVNAKFNEAFVMMEYFGYLRRDPDSSGFAYWLAKLNQFGGNFEQAEMVRAFIVSGEYRDRFPR
jgi:hypothetical protein